MVRDFSTLVGGVFDRFVEPRCFKRVRFVDGALTWPGLKGWDPRQVVDVSPYGLIWGRCPMPPTTRRPPSTMVFGDRPPKGVPMGVFRARLARRVLNAAVKAFDGGAPSIATLRGAADAAIEAGVGLSRRVLDTLEDASDNEAAACVKRRNGRKAKGRPMRRTSLAFARRRSSSGG